MWRNLKELLSKGIFSGLQIKAAYPESNGYATQGTSNGYAQESYGPQGGVATYTLSAEEYRAKHDLTVLGDNAPDPIQDFQSAGFTPDILDEVLKPAQPFQRLHSQLLPIQAAV